MAGQLFEELTFNSATRMINKEYRHVKSDNPSSPRSTRTVGDTNEPPLSSFEDLKQNTDTGSKPTASSM